MWNREKTHCYGVKTEVKLIPNMSFLIDRLLCCVSPHVLSNSGLRDCWFLLSHWDFNSTSF